MLESVERDDGIEHLVCKWQPMDISDDVSVPEYCGLHLYDMLELLQGSTSAEMENRALSVLHQGKCVGRQGIAEVSVRIYLCFVHARKQQRAPEE